MQIPKVRVLEHFYWLDSDLSIVGKHARDEIHQFFLWLVLMKNHLPRTRLDNGEIVMSAFLFLVQINIFLRRSAKDLHDLDQLFLRTITRKDWL